MTDDKHNDLEEFVNDNRLILREMAEDEDFGWVAEAFLEAGGDPKYADD